MALNLPVGFAENVWISSNFQYLEIFLKQEEIIYFW